jgi:hypothetical protein
MVLEDEFSFTTLVFHMLIVSLHLYGKLMPDPMYSSSALVKFVTVGAPSIAAARFSNCNIFMVQVRNMGEAT